MSWFLQWYYFCILHVCMNISYTCVVYICILTFFHVCYVLNKKCYTVLLADLTDTRPCMSHELSLKRNLGILPSALES